MFTEVRTKKAKPRTKMYSAVVINVKLIQGKPTSIRSALK